MLHLECHEQHSMLLYTNLLADLRLQSIQIQTLPILQSVLLGQLAMAEQKQQLMLPLVEFELLVELELGLMVIVLQLLLPEQL